MSDSPKMQRSSSSGVLASGGASVLACTGRGGDAGEPLPRVPAYLSVNSITKRRKLPKSTGNLHAYMAEDYRQLNWPLPKMYGQEKYAFSLVDVELKGRPERAASKDHRFVKETGIMSKKLIRLQYDFQIVDHEWRTTLKKLKDAEHKGRTCGENASQKTKDMFKKEEDDLKKALLSLQEQKDMHLQAIKDVTDKCDAIRTTIKTEADLDELREHMESQTKDKISADSAFWRTKFDIRSISNAKR
jgi:hypothetical protein